jgi:hypothetical protein
MERSSATLPAAESHEPPAPAEIRSYDYERYSAFAGDAEDPASPEITVRYGRPASARPVRQFAETTVVIASQIGFLVWLTMPGKLPHLSPNRWVAAASIVMIGSIYLIELFRSQP